MNRLTQKKQKAHNFARAFLRTHEISESELFAGVAVLLECFRHNSLVFHTLELSSAAFTEKCEAINFLVVSLKLSPAFAFLLRAVLRYKEFNLLGMILVLLKQEFYHKKAIQEVVISSSHEISDDERKKLETTIYEKFPGTLRFVYEHDASLIAGVRIKSPLYYWEHSVAKTIRKLRLQLQAQEQS